jgi:O-antigen/teichoic acid export membrane protein
MAVISFPLFAVTFSLAPDLTLALYGDRYASSAPYLAMLSFAYYFNTILGFNGVTLRVFGAIRPVVLINLSAAVLNVVLNLLLIPTFGALGAAIGTSTALVLHNVLKQIGLQRRTGIALFDGEALRVYAVIAAGALALLVVELVTNLGLIVGTALAALVSTVVLALTRDELRIGDTFPEIARLPFAARLFGAPRRRSGTPQRDAGDTVDEDRQNDEDGRPTA